MIDRIAADGYYGCRMDIKRRLGKAYGLIKDTDETGNDDNAPARQAGASGKPTDRPGAVPGTHAGRQSAGTTDTGARAGQSARNGQGGRSATGTPARVNSPASAATSRALAASESFIKTGLPGIEKAAKFLLLLGRDEAATVIRHLKPEEIEKISRQIAAIESIDTAEANQILTEFGWLAKTQSANLAGGPDIAERMLEAAFGQEKAQEVFRRAVPEARKPFAFLNDFEASQLLVLLKDESPQVLAMILPYIDAKLASGVISALPPPVRTDVVRRIARLERAQTDIIERVEAVLRDKAARLGRNAPGERIDGAAVLANILKHVDSGMEDGILSGIEENDPTLSHDIRERLFTADDLLRVADRDMQKGLRDMSERDIALLLKGKSQSFRDKVLENVSRSKKTIVLEEFDILGTVRRDDVDKATKQFVGWFKKRWEDGDLVLDGDDDLID